MDEDGQRSEIDRGLILDAFGVELSEIERYIEQAWNNMYIGTANLQTADYCYKIPLATRDVVDVETPDLHVRLVIDGVKRDCMPVDTLRIFLKVTTTPT